VFIFCAFSLIGCPEHVALKKEQRASIRTVSINGDVPIQGFSVIPSPANPRTKCSLSGNQLNQKVLDDFGFEKHLIPLPQSCPLLRRGAHFWSLTPAGVRRWPVELHPYTLYLQCEKGGQPYTYNFQHPVLGVVTSGKTIWVVKQDNDVQITHYWETTPNPLDCQSMIEFMIERHNIDIYNDIGQILRKKFIAELQNSNLFNITKSEEADAEFQLKIRAFQLVSPGTGSYQPILMADGILTRHESEILWKKYDYITLFNSKLPAHRIIEYINNPELIRDAAAVASQIIAEGLVNDLKR